MQLIQLLQILVLAVVQGITEFLPISSDGHLVLTQEIFSSLGHPLPSFLLIEITLHFGTLLSILVIYRREIVWLLTKHRRVIPLLILGTIPVAILGVAMSKYAKPILEDPWIAGIMLFVTGTIVIWSSKVRPGDRKLESVTVQDALVVGFFQSLAILPGLSRSGCTIASGLGRGLNRQSAADFSFLLAIPALCGACAKGLLDFRKDPDFGVPVTTLAFGAVVSFLVGIYALRWLQAWLRSGKFHHFGIWCYFVGGALLIWLVAKGGSLGHTG